MLPAGNHEVGRRSNTPLQPTSGAPAAAVAGGFVAAWLARRAPMAHATVLAVIQTVAFGWALVNPPLRRSTPDWMWACLIVLTFAGIIVGALLQRRRIALANKPLQPTSGAGPGGEPEKS